MIRTICFTIALTFLISGCSEPESAENTTSENTGSSTSVSESDRDPQEKNQRPTVKLPDDLPDDIPIYPASRPTVAGSSAGGFNSSPSTLIHLETTDDIKAVREYYKTELGNHEWVLKTDLPGENIFSGDKGDRKLQIELHALPTTPPTVDVSIFFTQPEDENSSQP